MRLLLLVYILYYICMIYHTYDVVLHVIYTGTYTRILLTSVPGSGSGSVRILSRSRAARAHGTGTVGLDHRVIGLIISMYSSDLSQCSAAGGTVGLRLRLSLQRSVTTFLDPYPSPSIEGICTETRIYTPVLAVAAQHPRWRQCICTLWTRP